MAMTSENYVGVESRCNKICLECERIFKEFDEDNEELEIEAQKVYDEIVGMERELEIAITNIKTTSKQKKYEKLLTEIQFYKNGIYMIAHII